MKKSLIYFAPIMSIFVLSFITATYFMENIFNLMDLARINFSTTLPNSDLKILLCLGLIGFVGFVSMHRNR